MTLNLAEFSGPSQGNSQVEVASNLASDIC
jgi:hypothetical protein